MSAVRKLVTGGQALLGRCRAVLPVLAHRGFGVLLITANTDALGMAVVYCLVVP